MLVENFALLIPVFMLRAAVAERNSVLAQDFPPTEDEDRSTDILNRIVSIGFVGYLILPAVMLSIAYLYMTRGHPWSRLLREADPNAK